MREEKIFGLLGRRLGHSYSSAIHGLFGMPDYRHIELAPEELAEFIRRDDIGGLNVTIPYKLAAMELCDEISDEAGSIGCINTLVRTDDGVLHGYNTDAYGLEYAAQTAGIDFKGKKVLIFGSGGASMTCRAVAARSGAAETVNISRGGTDNYDNLDRHADAQILLNATPVGMFPHPEPMPADPARFPECEGVIDLIYNPCRTSFIMRAQELGIRCTNGLPMLVAQAAAAEELFTGKTISAEEIMSVLARVGRSMLNIVLVGMPGSGKSSVGRILAELTGRPLIDTDEEIVHSEGREIADIFAAEGEEYFRTLERDAISRAGNSSGSVIVTGGGAVMNAANYAPLHRNGRIYHLERDILELDRGGRPLSQNADLDEMYALRLPMYEKFRDAAIYNSGTPEEAAKSILEDMYENSCY